jgi:hypothetical protein
MGDNMSGNHNDKYEILNVDFKWTIQDEAIHRGMNYATANEKIIAELRRDEGVRLHAILKNAYQEGFLHGFEHKFDQHNYEEKKDG